MIDAEDAPAHFAHTTLLATELPESVEALCETVARCASDRVPVYPVGGRTALDYGTPPTRAGVVVDMRRLNRVVDYPAADMTITVEAGITLRRLQETLAAQGQRLTLDPPQGEHATLGGIYATNASGPRRYGYGRPRDQIIGIRFVDGAGRLIKGGGRVVKNVAGYDFPKLMTGALGTLGIIAELTLKVRPLPESAALVWCAFSSLELACDAITRLNVSRTRPVALELLNRRGLDKAASRGAPTFSSPWALAVGFEGSRAAVDWQIDALAAELGTPVTVVRDSDAACAWSALVELRTDARWRLAIQANVPPSGLLAWAERLETGDWLIQAHAGTAAVTSLQDGGDATYVGADFIEALRAQARSLGGSLTVMRWPEDWDARVDRFGIRAGSAPWARGVKAALDPHDLLNPGRMGG